MELAFYIAGAVAVISTGLMLTRLNVVHALLYLIVSLLGVAVVFYVLGAPFVAALEVIIYAGAIMVLFVFVVMMLNIGAHEVEIEEQWLTPGIWAGPVLLATILIIEVVYLVRSGTADLATSAVGPKQVGIALFGPYLIGVELASMLLLWISLVAIGLDFVLAANLWIGRASRGTQLWLDQLDWSWIPSFGIHFHLALDGLSLLMLMLTFFLGMVSVLASWTEIHEKVGFFHFNLMWVLAGISGVFLAVDLFLFYFAWELMLVPMYFLIVIWGHERRVYAAVKFFLFTQCSGLLMLIAILALYFFHHQATGVYTFEYSELLGTQLSPGTELWIVLGFFVAFAVKLPVVPLHTWLPDAHTEAPTAGSVILAGLLLKTGAYGLLRFVVPLFPRAAHEFTPIALVLAVIGIVYGSVMAFSQTDLKRLVAYTSVSHLGFVLLGIFSWNPLALQGAIMTMICHGLSTGGLFVLVGGLQERIHTRDLESMGGLWDVVPRLSGAALFFSLASLGLPGLGYFVGEFLVLLGSYKVSVTITVVASLGVLASTFYALRMVQRAFLGANTHAWKLPDLTPREGVMMTLMIVGLLWLGFYPQPVLDTFRPALDNLQRDAQMSVALLRR